MSFDDVLLSLFVLALGLPFVLGPLAVRAAHRARIPMGLAPYDPVRHDLPPALGVAVAQIVERLTAAGFGRVADLFTTDFVPHSELRTVLLTAPDGLSLALVVAAQVKRGKIRISQCRVEFVTKFSDGRTLTVNNSDQVQAWPSVPHRLVEQFPDVRDPLRLWEVQRAWRARRLADAAPVAFDPGADPTAFLEDAARRELDDHVAAGHNWRDDAAGVYRATWKGALLATARLTPPVGPLLLAGLRRRARRLVRDLGLEGADAYPVIVPRAGATSAWTWLLAFGVFVALLLGRLPARDHVSVPPDFAVPKDFDGAVRALESLAGAAARPLVGRDSVGDSIPTRGVWVPVSARRSEALIEAVGPLFLAQGFLLFRSEQHFGLGDEPDHVALYPGRDPYEVLRLVGTNAWNYGFGPDSIVRWLRALAPREPFVVTGIGFDWVEGRFLGEIRDPDALARRLHAFCPDVVDQGTGSVEALARDLRRNRTLYCWWD